VLLVWGHNRKGDVVQRFSKETLIEELAKLGGAERKEILVEVEREDWRKTVAKLKAEITELAANLDNTEKCRLLLGKTKSLFAYYVRYPQK
jgi:hypothetical protein